MKIFRIFFDAFTMLFLWLILAGGLGLVITIPSPHGMAAFAVSGIVLGIVGGVFHAIFYIWKLIVLKQYLSPMSGCVIGIFCGISAFPISTLIYEHQLLFPNNSFLFALTIFLIVVGSFVGWLVARIFKFARLIESDSWKE